MQEIYQRQLPRQGRIRTLLRAHRRAEQHSIGGQNCAKELTHQATLQAETDERDQNPPKFAPSQHRVVPP